MTGEGNKPEGALLTPQGTSQAGSNLLLQRLCQAAVLTNDAFLGHRDHDWVTHGDAVDIALLVMAHKAGVVQTESLNAALSRRVFRLNRHACFLPA